MRRAAAARRRAGFVPNPDGMERAGRASTRAGRASTGPTADITERLQAPDYVPILELTKRVLESEAAVALKRLLAKHDRVAVTGMHGAGKTTLCRCLKDRVMVDSDSFKDQGYSSQPFAQAVNAIGRQVLCCGVMVPKAMLDHGLKAGALLVLEGSHDDDLQPGHLRQATTIRNQLEQCMTRGVLDGVEVVFVKVR